ncbi:MULTISPECIES: copper homeostasis protein CutC [Tatumella]|uniref:PF03932 family protein CutC n=1 Tax=Tatumella punctata TaxID=399969 RepID=A0ABW1VJ77_9GAMM|nr:MULTISPECIES: copper homeostasis protein CutC [unclassified Tatumella]MBS0877218.1 copper homeostasis protein CutC [Tatumella sp. JGM82]MBS0889413.1 copper homeostasis protein CutC [Tatumella sp. JGM94]MBS0901615.1 copper homeostasis protein CutC [Tatumella sp. JGM100]
MAILEICCYGADCALQAAEAGADRIELCAGPREGGLTPSAGVLQQVINGVTVPVHPIVRPRGGDFCYSDREFAAMTSDIALIKQLGFAGVVVGILDRHAHIDIARMREIMQLCDGMAVTFHRAFDLCHNPYRALDELTELGVARILTSGQQEHAENGLSLLSELNIRSRGPVIMAGSGVRLSNLHRFTGAGIREIHSSASKAVSSPMHYRKAGVSMSSHSADDEFTRYIVDGEMVSAMKSMMQ